MPENMAGSDNISVLKKCNILTAKGPILNLAVLQIRENCYLKSV
jgi:hypothetical protein